MNLAGMPAQISFGGMFLLTTLPAPIIEPVPIDTPFKITQFVPIQTLPFITIELTASSCSRIGEFKSLNP